mgnify:FL=1
MATLSLDDPRFQTLKVTEEDKDKEKESNSIDIDTALYKDKNEIPEAEEDNEISGLTATTAGILSAAIKIPEGFASVTAELFDLGGGKLLGVPDISEKDISYAVEVEKFWNLRCKTKC